jgi:pimeloyl-ACP methyl ester carboxylesterase
VNETVVQFGPARGLIGIVTTPPPALRDPARPAVVLLNAGLMHRVGPNRIYVQLARALAAAGHTVLRFDFSGLGDSRPRADHLPYAQSAPLEAREAMDWLAEHHGARHFYLMGHCAGAIFSLLVARDDSRVVGAALINPEGGDAQWTEIDRKKKVSQQHARNYGRHALFSRERWAKLLSGKADYRSIARVVFKDIIWYRIVGLSFRVRQRLKGSQPEIRAAQAAHAAAYLDPIIMRGAALILLHSEGSTGLDQIRATFGPELDRRIAAGAIQLAIIPQSDHLFTLVARQHQVCTTLVNWARSRSNGSLCQAESRGAGDVTMAQATHLNDMANS